jgi:CRISPR type I-E-associated protein CasA/Cse1
MQDLTLLQELAELDESVREDRTKRIGDLLIDLPTGKTVRDNTDFFIKRGQFKMLCPACAGTALLTMQINAPSGGQGHRTGIRGGGPLTTLILADSLWSTCWLNVLVRGAFLRQTGNPAKNSPSDQFPWLAATRTNVDVVRRGPSLLQDVTERESLREAYRHASLATRSSLSREIPELDGLSAEGLDER